MNPVKYDNILKSSPYSWPPPDNWPPDSWFPESWSPDRWPPDSWSPTVNPSGTWSPNDNFCCISYLVTYAERIYDRIKKVDITYICRHPEWKTAIHMLAIIFGPLMIISVVFPLYYRRGYRVALKCRYYLYLE